MSQASSIIWKIIISGPVIRFKKLQIWKTLYIIKKMFFSVIRKYTARIKLCGSINIFELKRAYTLKYCICYWMMIFKTLILFMPLCQIMFPHQIVFLRFLQICDDLVSCSKFERISISYIFKTYHIFILPGNWKYR